MEAVNRESAGVWFLHAGEMGVRRGEAGGEAVTIETGVDADYVLSALLKHNYFPAHKADLTELPPVFSSRSLDEQVASDLASSTGRAKGCGYDSVRYLSTRYNNVPRPLSLPHPVPHSRLAQCIHDNWDSLKWIRDNENSLIRPQLHSDGRLFTMDYGGSAARVVRELRRAFGKRYLALADVNSCYPSIYTHSIPWAAVGRSTAKTRRRQNEWFNVLDSRVREAKRGETHGIVVGPATSGIIAEFILGRVDEALRQDFSHARYIDDFQAFCETEEEALTFIRRLSGELRQFNLELNARKTTIQTLPRTNSPDWLHQLSLWAPTRDLLTVHDVTNYLDLSLGMSGREPDGSVLKYAVKAIRGRAMRDDALFALITYALNLSYHNAILIPLVDKMFDEMESRGFALNYGESIKRLVGRYADSHSSDGLSWSLHFAERHGLTIEADLASAVLACGDCIALAQLRRIGDAATRQMVLDFAKSLVAGVVDEVDKYELDQYWLLLYELFLDGEIANPYTGENAFDIMSSAGVRFMN